MPELKPKTRKPGRPSLPKGEAKGKRFTHPELRLMSCVGIGVKAKTGKQSVSEWIRSTLNAAMESLRDETCEPTFSLMMAVMLGAFYLWKKK